MWVAPPETQKKRGYLASIGQHRLGLDTYEFVKCVTCGEEFPILERNNYATCIQDGYIVIDRRPSCNCHVITLCPWCREDSAPWTNGRGL